MMSEPIPNSASYRLAVCPTHPYLFGPPRLRRTERDAGQARQGSAGKASDNGTSPKFPSSYSSPMDVRASSMVAQHCQNTSSRRPALPNGRSILARHLLGPNNCALKRASSFGGLVGCDPPGSRWCSACVLQRTGMGLAHGGVGRLSSFVGCLTRGARELGGGGRGSEQLSGCGTRGRQKASSTVANGRPCCRPSRQAKSAQAHSSGRKHRWPGRGNSRSGHNAATAQCLLHAIRAHQPTVVIRLT